jgi:hypothetical protein
MIREIIREELDYSLNRLEKNIQEAIVKNKVTKIYEEAPKDDVFNQLQNKLDGERVPSSNHNVVNTKNQILNDILNETKESGEWKDIEKEAEVKSVVDNTDQLPEHLAKAFTKDYSGVMKKVEEKAKFKNGG